MVTANRVSGNTLIILVSKILNLALTLLFTVLVARRLGESALGMFSFGLVFVGSFAIIADFGLQQIVARELSQMVVPNGRLFANGIFAKLLLIIISIVVITIAVVFLDFETAQGQIILVLCIVLFSSPKIASLRRFLEVPFQIELKMLVPSALQVLDIIIMICATFLVLSYGYGIVAVTVIYALAFLPGFFFQTKRTFIWLKPEWKLSKETMMSLVRESYPLALYVAGITLISNIDIFIIKLFWTDSEIGYYSAATRIIMPINFIPMAILASIFPLMSRYSVSAENKMKDVLSIGFKLFFLMGLAISLVCVIWGEAAITLLYGTRFSSAILPFKAIIISLPFLFVHFFLVEFNTAVGAQKRNQSVVIICLLFNFCLNLVLIPKMGINGAAYARLFTSILSCILPSIYCYSYFDASIRFDIIKLLVIGIAVICCAYFLEINSWTKSILLSTVLVAATVWSRVFSKGEWHIIKQLTPLAKTTG